MNSDKLDELAKAVAVGASRRAVLRRLGAGVGGGLLSLVGAARATARQGDAIYDHACDCWRAADGSVVAVGGNVATETSIALSADGGVAVTDASGGNGNGAVVSGQPGPRDRGTIGTTGGMRLPAGPPGGARAKGSTGPPGRPRRRRRPG